MESKYFGFVLLLSVPKKKNIYLLLGGSVYVRICSIVGELWWQPFNLEQGLVHRVGLLGLERVLR